jgi:hypothetical protein
MPVRLPPPCENQAYFTLTPLDAGSLEVLEEFVVSDPTSGKQLAIPSLAFLLRHSSSKFNALFDLGIKKNLAFYSPLVQDVIKAHCPSCSGNLDVSDSLQNSGTGLSPIDITHT